MRLQSIGDRLLGSVLIRRAYPIVQRTPLLGPLLRRWIRNVVPRGSWRWIRVPRGLAKGKYMLLDPRYELGYVRGDHEPWLGELLSQCLRRGDTFVDVGAHIGYFSLCAAALVGHRGKVLAFEPDPENFSRLEDNISRNALSGVVFAVRAAVGAGKGQALFRRSTGTTSRQGHVTSHIDDDGEHIDVSVVCLDDALIGLEPRMVKIDVEGGETAVLRGALGMLRHPNICWVVEVHNSDTSQDAKDILEAAGYQVEILRPSHPIYRDFRQEYAVARMAGFQSR